MPIYLELRACVRGRFVAWRLVAAAITAASPRPVLHAQDHTDHAPNLRNQPAAAEVVWFSKQWLERAPCHAIQARWQQF